MTSRYLGESCRVEPLQTVSSSVVRIGDHVRYALVSRANAIDFIPDVLGIAPLEDFSRTFGVEFAGYQDWDFPFVLGFVYPWAIDLRAEDNAPLRVCFSAASALFIARPRGKEDNGIGRIDEHRGINDDVLVDT